MERKAHDMTVDELNAQFNALTEIEKNKLVNKIKKQLTKNEIIVLNTLFDYGVHK